jgi:hypothetical protein
VLTKVIAALQQEGLQQKAWAEDILDPATTASAKTKSKFLLSKIPCNPTKHFTLFYVYGHELNNCFKTARILQDHKSRQGKANSNPPNPGQSDKSKSKKLSNPPSKAGKTSAAPLGGTTHLAA